MSLMNGNPYYSAPTRHTRSLGDKFIEQTVPAAPKGMEEMPFLVARAIAAGLIKPPEKEELEPEPRNSDGSTRKQRVADWQKITCIRCKEPFIRMAMKHDVCTECRLQKSCTVCGTMFRAKERWLKCCSDACVKKSFKKPVKLRPIHNCIACGSQFEARMSGAGWAKTCNAACAKVVRDNHHAERRALRLATKGTKQ